MLLKWVGLNLNKKTNKKKLKKYGIFGKINKYKLKKISLKIFLKLIDPYQIIPNRIIHQNNIYLINNN